MIAWSSEEKNCVIPYKSPIDGKYHRYFIDFWIKVRDRSGPIKEYLVEIKPEHETLPPAKQKKATKKYLRSVSTFLTNQAKWKAAKKRADRKGMKFVVLTEKHLGV